MRRNPQFPFSPISRDQALQLYDEGKQIYLVRTSLRPTIVTERVEIERGSDVFQIATAELELEKSREESLLQSSEKQFGIYQITERDPEHDYRFMGLDYVQKKGITVARADYDLIYAAPLTEKDTLDGIYERFNIQRPADFTGHSLSVSDVVVLNDGESVKAYYVDSIGFAELPDFFKERNIDLQKENLLNEELQEIEIFDKPGLFSNGRLRDEDVPEGLYRYDLRGSDYDPGQPITVEKTVVVNHAASVLMAEELDLGAEGRLELGEEGLNFTGAELTVREFMEEQQQKNNALIHGDSYHIAVEGHIGTWYAIDETEVGGEKFFLLEHEEHGDMAACVAVNEQGKLVAEDLWNGFDEDFQEAVQKYFSEKWNMPKKEDVVSEIIEKAVPVPNNSEKDYSDVPVYYEPFSYAKENDEVDLYIPSPYLVINAVTESMLNRVTFGDEQLRREFGKEVIESYLYDIASQVKTVSWISKEIVYNVGHQEIRSPDVLVGEGEKMTFYDTKAFSPSLRLRSLDRTEIENDIARYAKNVIQLYKQIVNYLAGKFELDKHYEKKDIFGVVVVLEDAVVSRKKVYDKVFLELERTAHLDDEEKRYIHSHIKVLPLREVETFMLQNMSPLPFLVEQVENENQWDNYRYGCPQKENGLIAEYESYVKKLKSMLIARIRTV